MLKKRGRHSKKDTIDLTQLSILASFGLTDEQLAKTYNISVPTLNSYKKDAIFIKALKKGKEIADEQVKIALFKRATGYEHPDIDIRALGGKIVQTEIIKHYPPDTAAAIFWLLNRDPENWKQRRSDDNSDKSSDDRFKELMEVIKAGPIPRGKSVEGS